MKWYLGSENARSFLWMRFLVFKVDDISLSCGIIENDRDWGDHPAGGLFKNLIQEAAFCLCFPSFKIHLLSVLKRTATKMTAIFLALSFRCNPWRQDGSCIIEEVGVVIGPNETD